MKPTIEEVKRVAEELGANIGVKHITDSTGEMILIAPEELQAFAQHYKEEGRKEQRESAPLPRLMEINFPGEDIEPLV